MRSTASLLCITAILSATCLHLNLHADSQAAETEPAIRGKATERTAATSGPTADDWQRIWHPNGAAMPAPQTVHVGSLSDLGQDLENRDWQMVQSQYHQIYFQPSADRKTVSELYQLIDGLYVFLRGRNPAKPQTPIRAFLVPGERGHSRCTQVIPAMRTGDMGDLRFILTSLLHEETHLFNFAFLGQTLQGWWAGEFSCQYFQERAGLEAEGQDIRKELGERLPTGPVARLAELNHRGQQAFNEAIAAMFFFEQRYGTTKLNEFRRQCLISDKATKGQILPDSVFARAFRKDVATLDKEWRAFFGWSEAHAVPQDPRLQKKVTFASGQPSVQDIVQNLAEQVGLGYNFDKSYDQTQPTCRSYVNNVNVQNKPCHEALQQILGPAGLVYRIEDGAIVLYRR